MIVFYVATTQDALGQNLFKFIEVIIGLSSTVALIVVGWNILNLKSKLGTIAVWYGCLELLSAIGITFLYPTSEIFIGVVLYILGAVMFFRLAGQKLSAPPSPDESSADVDTVDACEAQRRHHAEGKLFDNSGGLPD